jgi:parvulin-like peptidyl-prolyl isomerase
MTDWPDAWPAASVHMISRAATFSQAVRMLLANRLVLQEIYAKKWDQQPNVSARLERVRQNALVELYLQQVSALPANFPSDDDLQKVYDAYRAALLVPRQFQLAQIFVALPKGADKAAEDQPKKTVDDLERKLKTPGADFASLANNNGAKNGGDLGLLRENQIRPEIRAKVIELPKGAASEPTRLEDGWHLVKLIDTGPPKRKHCRRRAISWCSRSGASRERTAARLHRRAPERPSATRRS